MRVLARGTNLTGANVVAPPNSGLKTYNFRASSRQFDAAEKFRRKQNSDFHEKKRRRRNSRGDKFTESTIFRRSGSFGKLRGNHAEHQTALAAGR
ncbi:MAG: hypothetical protein ACR2N3_16570 [Pyrinomonadaceae bacterium]